MYISLNRTAKLIASPYRALQDALSFNRLVIMCAAIAFMFADTPSHAADTADFRKDCESLKGQMVGGASLVDTALVTPTSGAGGDYCKVSGKIHGTLGFDVHMPVQWNRKLVYAGGGGFNGYIHPKTYSPSGNSGYALVASDSGHQGSPFDASWALNNPRAQKEYADLSVHTVLLAANAIVEKYYRTSIQRRYFEGCSNGGREALISATRFPHDFDGIVARAPAWNLSKMFLAFNRNVKQQLGVAGGALTAENLTTLGDAITAKCDTLDGLKDGVVSNPAACKFDVAALRCKGEKNDRCLSAEQVETVNTYFSPANLADGTTYYPGWRPSGVEGMREGLGSFLIAAVPPPGAPSQLVLTPNLSHPHSTASSYVLQAGLIDNFLLADPRYDTLKFKPEDHLPGLALLSTMLDATPDLSTFFALGHKLILWHGTGDSAISDKGSIQYFDAVADAVGGADVRDASMEFFLSPGVGHCVGGPGPDTVDLLAPLVAWVEGGQRPSGSKMVARKVNFATGEDAASRPVCRYPAYPHYAGLGDPGGAESFVCKTPDAKQ